MTAVPNFVTIALDTNGLVASGARMYWFAAGTETPATVYSDSTLTTPYAHPINADTAGVFPPVYANAGSYKLRIKLSAAAGGATLYEVDNLTVTAAGSEINFPTSVKTGNFSVTANDRGKVFLCDASGIGGLNLIVTADSATLGDGFPFFVVNNAATGTITVQGTGGQTVDGQASITIGSQYESLGLVSIGALGWQRIMSSASQTFSTLVTFNGPVAMGTATLTDSAVIAWNAATGANFQVTLGGNRTLGAFTGSTNGQEGYLTVKQDATGGRTLDFSNSVYDWYGGPIQDISRAANAETVYRYRVISSSAMTLERVGGTALVASGEVLLRTGTAAAASTLDIPFTSLPTGFRAMRFLLTGLTASSDTSGFRMRTSTDGGSTYDAGASDYSYAQHYDSVQSGTLNGHVATGDDFATFIELLPELGGDANETATLDITLYDHARATLHKLIAARAVWIDDSILKNGTMLGIRFSANDIDAVRFLPASGTFSCDYAVYGIL